MIIKAYKHKAIIPEFIIKEASEEKSENDDINRLYNLFNFIGKSFNEEHKCITFNCNDCHLNFCKSHIVPLHKIEKLIKDNKIPISKIKANKYLIANNCEKITIDNVRYLRGLSIRDLDF
jgi:hypothetical protein